MNTTGNQTDEIVPGTAKTGITKEDAKAMKADYVNGTNISVLAEQYGYTEAEVESVVVEAERDVADHVEAREENKKVK